MPARRLSVGFGSGLIAALVMAIPALLGYLVDPGTIPEPVPIALVNALSARQLGYGEALAWGTALHFAYGGGWGLGLALLYSRPTARSGTGLGFVLWIIMLAGVMVFLGRQFVVETGAIVFTFSTLILHLAYGYVLGWLLEQGA